MAKRKTAVEIDATELKNNFRSALHKREQIEIEADLHCCSPRAIAEVLDQIGELKDTGITPRQFSDRYDPVPPAASAGRPRKSIDEAKAMKFFEKGDGVEAIARACGVSRTYIEAWIKRNGLARSKPKPGPKPKYKSSFKLEGGESVEKPDEERHEEILESMNAGKKSAAPQITCSRTEPCDPCTFPARESCAGCSKEGSTVVIPAAAPTRCQPGKAVGVWDGYIVPEPSRISMELRENVPMSVKQFRVAMCKLLSDALDDAALSINGETVRDIFGVEIVVRAGRVMVDLRTKQEAG